MVMGADRYPAGDDHHVRPARGLGRCRRGGRGGHRAAARGAAGAPARRGQADPASARWSCGSRPGRAARPGARSSSPVQSTATWGRGATVTSPRPAVDGRTELDRAQPGAGVEDPCPGAHVLARAHARDRRLRTLGGGLDRAVRATITFSWGMTASAPSGPPRRSRCGSPPPVAGARSLGRAGAGLADHRQPAARRPGWTA